METSSLDVNGIEVFVCDLLADFIEVQPAEIARDADIFEVYQIESLQLVEMITALESKFGKRLDFDDFREARTAKEISQRVLIAGS